ncbi:MAG TPA: RecQ family ATP-dependent DNA helicase [Bryobacteraceae bacterium]|nr:RecQ family ATP-dependent DNA helicase [Bryobacteraceae bacterium]
MDLLKLLEKHWGYTQFRPKQESVVRSILEGRDVAAIMPTGGGKSLCYQLPAAAMDRVSVVVSPLIALMQDQAAHLETAGIPAAVLNSSIAYEEQRAIMRRAERGELRLLYVSPERLVRDDVLAWLMKIPLGFFAIDEAHCISEWGHEFRPEYRKLRALREWFPKIPIAAFTASATRAVRHDIVAQLKLRDPAKITMSFHRPNLRYIVHECAAREQDRRLEAALRHYTEGNLIVYAPTISAVEETAALLRSKGFPAVAYHGQMDTAKRSRNQEIWMTGEKRVLVGTLAFGLGINKPDVRAVIHLALPKSVEQYYQEAGRAGRDGLPADCILLWQKRDAGLLVHFIQQLQDEDEKQRAWKRYHAMRKFVEGEECRHRQICLHFGETPSWASCGACDVCGATPDWLRKPAKAAAGSKLAAAEVRKKAAPKCASENDLRGRLKKWRTEKAKELSVPAFVILHDATIEAIAERAPATVEELMEVKGIGKAKAEKFGEAILRVVSG